VRPALTEAAAIKKIALSGQDELAAPLRLGAIHTIGPYLLPLRIQPITEQATRMPLLVEENYTAVLRGLVEIIFTFGHAWTITAVFR